MITPVEDFLWVPMLVHCHVGTNKHVGVHALLIIIAIEGVTAQRAAVMVNKSNM